MSCSLLQKFPRAAMQTYWYMCIFKNKHAHSHTAMESLFKYMHTCAPCADTQHLGAQSHTHPHTFPTPTPPHTEALLQWMQSLTHVGVQQVDAVQTLAAVDSALDSAQGWFAVGRSLRFIQEGDGFWGGDEGVDLGIVTKTVTDSVR